ncbi:MAG TPA: preprotein translocase subunit SecG [Candidatus Eisenbacteria bacterium]|nr:preprotein translocase subunit SecG [Candidatus Eisenbacteria bacterium]
MPDFLVALFTGVHILACIALMVTILLQSGKGGGLAGAFGGGSSQTLFGGRGAASFLSRASTVLAVVFFVTSLTLGLAASRNATARPSLIQEEARRRATQRAGTTGQPGAPAPGQPSQQAPAGQPPSGTAPPSGAPTSGAPTTNAPTPPATTSGSGGK